MPTSEMDQIDAPSDQDVFEGDEAKTPVPVVSLKRGIALCLSGGGYRAALFHLGVLRCLHDMGILQKVEVISSVSGGSIISAYLARRLFEENISGGISFVDWEHNVSSGFRAFVRNDVRTGPFLVHVLWNWLMPKCRVRHLQRNYAKRLLTIQKDDTSRQMALGDLPQHPEFIFCSTDVSFGINWEFRRDKVGDYHAGYAAKNDWPVALAVAASSCFPPIFGPLRIWLDPKEFKGGKYRKADRDYLVQGLKLSDGGVYDNFGIEPIDSGFSTVVISDGGSPFGYLGNSNVVRRLMRYVTVMMNQVASLRKRMFFTGIAKKWHDGAYINIGHDRTTKQGTTFDGYVDEELRNMIAGIRTDLDRFTQAEACILENHGYYEAYRRIKGKLPDLMANPEFEGITPHQDWTNELKLKRLLRAAVDGSFFPGFLD